MLRFACFITGDDYQMLKSDTPSSKKKVVTLVSILFLPVTMWFINILLLVSGVMRGSQITAIIAALFASWLIFMVERSIIMSNGSRVVMVFRILLGLFIAILGSLALDEVVFKRDIDKQMSRNKELMISQAKDEVAASFANDLVKQGDLVNEKQKTWNKSLENVSNEADGSGGSGMRGVHEITRLKMDLAGQTEQDYHTAKDDLDKLSNRLEKSKSEAVAMVNSSFDENALLERIKAMFDLVVSNGWMLFVYSLVTLLLFSLEFIVVILKICLPKSNYEFKLEIIEEIGKKRLMRLRDHDNYDVIRHSPMVRKSNNSVMRLSQSSIFN